MLLLPIHKLLGTSLVCQVSRAHLRVERGERLRSSRSSDSCNWMQVLLGNALYDFFSDTVGWEAGQYISTEVCIKIEIDLKISHLLYGNLFMKYTYCHELKILRWAWRVPRAIRARALMLLSVRNLSEDQSPRRISEESKVNGLNFSGDALQPVWSSQSVKG